MYFPNVSVLTIYGLFYEFVQPWTTERTIDCAQFCVYPVYITITDIKLTADKGGEFLEVLIYTKSWLPAL